MYDSTHHWWSPSGRGCLSSAISFKFKEFDHNNLIEFGPNKRTKLEDTVTLTEKFAEVTVYFSTKEIEREFQAATAYEIDDADYLVAHIVQLDATTPGTISVMFDPNLEGSLMVKFIINNSFLATLTTSLSLGICQIKSFFREARFISVMNLP